MAENKFWQNFLIAGAGTLVGAAVGLLAYSGENFIAWLQKDDLAVRNFAKEYISLRQSPSGLKLQDLRTQVNIGEKAMVAILSKKDLTKERAFVSAYLEQDRGWLSALEFHLQVKILTNELETIKPNDDNISDLLSEAQRIAARAGDFAAYELAQLPDDIRVLRAKVEDLTTSGQDAKQQGKVAKLLNDTVERIVNDSSALDVRFLKQAWESAGAVGLLRHSAGSRATAILIEPGIILTVHHALENIGEARDAEFVTDHLSQNSGSSGDTSSNTFALDPNQLFCTSKDLDTTVAALSTTSLEGTSLDTIHHISIDDRSSGEPVVGDRVTVVHHAKGGPKLVSLREGRVLLVQDKFVHYQAATGAGSSGSPVFGDSLNLIAMHHSRVAKTNENGQMLTVAGDVWDGNNANSIQWIAKEGVRVSSIAKWLQQSCPQYAAMKSAYN